MAHWSPIHWWKSTEPWVVSATKFGAVSLMRSMVDLLGSDNERSGFSGNSLRHHIVAPLAACRHTHAAKGIARRLRLHGPAGPARPSSRRGADPLVDKPPDR
jgi:hypothetical protein